jgi:hydrogenase maturation protein HypF
MRQQLRVEIHGAVQGVGFRPHLFRLAKELLLDGWVANDTRGILVTVEGDQHDLDRFLERLTRDKPAPAVIQEIRVDRCAPHGLAGFHIESSRTCGAVTAQVLPDIATCDDCLREVRDSGDRRNDYPFTNCTRCGPRFTILHSLPYDRPRTSMARFIMCALCQTEYGDPYDRRFHAQPNACPECGPNLYLWDAAGKELTRGSTALHGAADAIREGMIVAVKGLGGFHLMVDACDAIAVARLQRRKERRHKPLALMVEDLEAARELCVVSSEAAAILSSPEAPILFLPRRPDAPVDEAVAPGNPRLGIMLAYTPLHHLLLGDLGFPVVATSGNLSDEPICTDEQEALGRLARIADRFLVHDRPIVRHADDSIAWDVAGSVRLLRRARGYAPRPVLLDSEGPAILAVGPHLKNTVALRVGAQVFLSQHIGDMGTPEALDVFERIIADLLDLYGATPVAIAHDQHPDYLSTMWARDTVSGSGPSWGSLPCLAGLRLVPVQHHHAHLAACLADSAHPDPALGVTWDGTGYGPDGTVWGGEFLRGDADGFKRVAHLWPFRLPGGDAAAREPRRSALGLLWALGGERAWERSEVALHAFRPGELTTLAGMLRGGVHAPLTTSAGRLFDGVAALLGLHPRSDFEGQAAMALEYMADPEVRDAYPIELAPAVDLTLAFDWRPLLDALLEEVRRGVARGRIAARFHNALVNGIVEVARAVGEPAVALTGGCFQNRLLMERTAGRLEAAGFKVLMHRQVPPNDGGISLGQIAVAAARLRRG